MSLKPLCFVVMPSGLKPAPCGLFDIDFDRIYNHALKPGIEEAGMEPLRVDEERTGGIIHRPMFERFLLCDYVLVDLTTANPDVFYELGVRHAMRPARTLTMYAKHQKPPIDVDFLRSLSYDLGRDNVFGADEARVLREAVRERLVALRDQAGKPGIVNSALFRLLMEWEAGDVARLKTDVFRDQVRLNEGLKRQMSALREKGRTGGRRDEARRQLRDLQKGLGDLSAVDTGTVVDLYLSFRALGDWNGMIALYEDMPEVLKRQVLVREQLGFAYNRRAGKACNPADRSEALRILKGVEEQQGPSSETSSLIGRVHKDNWKEALENGLAFEARGHLDKSIDAYVRGFLADQRDAFPGINAVTLLDIRGDEESLKQRDRLLPVVRFAVEQRLRARPDYWDHASMLEIAVLGDDVDAADTHLARALYAVRESWEPKSTANNLRMIERARAERPIDTSWLLRIIEALEAKGETAG